MSNDSKNYRQKANNHYFKATETLAPVLFQYNLNEAIILYNNALKITNLPSEQASLHKNLAMSYSKMNLKETIFSKQTTNLLVSFKEFVNAYTLGKASKKDKLWLENIETEMLKTLRNSRFLNGLDRINYHYKIFFLIPNEISVAKTLISIALSRLLFNESVKNLEAKDYKQTLKMLADGQHPLESSSFTLKLIKNNHYVENDNLFEEIQDLKESFKTTETQAKCLLILDQANQLHIKKEIIYSESSTNYDDIFAILDLYKQVVLYSQGRDLESEAEAFSNMGKIFYKLLKNNKKSHDYLLQSINLAMALRPIVMEDKNWFKSAKLLFEQLQIEFQETEDTKTKEERDKLAKEFVEELSDIEINASKSLEEFILFLCDKFKKQELEEVKTFFQELLENMKKNSNLEDSFMKKKKLNFFKVLKLFHPDKQAEEKDRKMRFLSSEITRHLNDKYTVHFKG